MAGRNLSAEQLQLIEAYFADCYPLTSYDRAS